MPHEVLVAGEDARHGPDSSLGGSVAACVITSVNVGLPRRARHGRRHGAERHRQGAGRRPRGAWAARTWTATARPTSAVHGGVDKAVYAYPVEHYAALGDASSGATTSRPGFFGENLTTRGAARGRRPGSATCLRIGTALFEVSQPRVPCFKLVARSGRSGLRQAVPASAAGRGFYLRVLEEGERRAPATPSPASVAARGASSIRAATALLLGRRRRRTTSTRAAATPALAARLARVVRGPRGAPQIAAASESMRISARTPATYAPVSP